MGSRWQQAYSDPAYKAMKAALAVEWVVCPYCKWRRATSPDHVPPLSEFPPGLWRGRLVPACLKCNMARGGADRQRRRVGKVVRRKGTFR